MQCKPPSRVAFCNLRPVHYLAQGRQTFVNLCGFSFFFSLRRCGTLSAHNGCEETWERVLMKNPLVQRKGSNGNGHSKKLMIEWTEGETFCLEAREGSFFRPGHQTNTERSYYVKL